MTTPRASSSIRRTCSRYNRFSGIDRQETGLRANVGVHYAGNFADGSWIDAIAGQSFHLLGVNALGVPDAAQIGTSTGLGSTASYIVASVRGGFSNGVNLGGKIQVDPAGPRVTRAAAGISFKACELRLGRRPTTATSPPIRCSAQ